MNRNTQNTHGSIILGVCVIVLVSGCAPREKTLGGTRIATRLPLSESTDLISSFEETEIKYYIPAPKSGRLTALKLPPIQNLSDWTHVNGNTRHGNSHPQLGSPIKEIWRSSIGSGNSKNHKISTAPIVADSRIFTIDSQSVVSAHTTSGSKIWSQNLNPVTDKGSDLSGGGLAYADGRLYATYAGGSLVAFEPESGGIFWRQDFESSTIYPPAADKGRVYLVEAASKGWSVNGSNGRLGWNFLSSKADISLAGDVSPSISQGIVILPYPSGEMLAVNQQSGQLLWRTHIAGTSLGAPRTSLIGISGSPVISNGTVYVATIAGSLASVDLRTGAINSIRKIGASSTILPVDSVVFVISDEAKLLSMDAQSGETIWQYQLPYFKNSNPRRRKAVFAHYGPVLAGGRLVVASSDEMIREFDPELGTLINVTALPGGASAQPAFSGGVMYVVSTEGVLHAFQ